MVPILAGSIVLLVGAWMVAAAINNPLVLPGRADGVGLDGDAGSTSRREIAVPPDLIGEIDVFVTSSVQGWDAEVRDAADPGSEWEREILVGGARRAAGNYRLIAAIDAASGSQWVVAVPASIGGRVAFVDRDDPPAEVDVEDVLVALAMTLAGATIAAVGIVRRIRWRADLARYKEHLAATGYVVD